MYTNLLVRFIYIQVLNDIANESKGGTFSDISESTNLSKAFAQCLGGLLTVLVQDLKLTITQVDNQSKINKVSAGNYPKTETDRSVTILFDELYNNEVRRVLVDLLLAKVDSKKRQQVLQVQCTYRWVVLNFNYINYNYIYIYICMHIRKHFGHFDLTN